MHFALYAELIIGVNNIVLANVEEIFIEKKTTLSKFIFVLSEAVDPERAHLCPGLGLHPQFIIFISLLLSSPATSLRV